MEAKADNTVPYAAGGNTLDLSSQLEKQLTEQFTEERELAAALEKVRFQKNPHKKIQRKQSLFPHRLLQNRSKPPARERPFHW